jgi:hypothetical protein
MGKYLKKKKNQTGSFLLAVVMLVLLAALICAAVFLGKQYQTPEQTTEPTVRQTEAQPEMTELLPMELSQGLVIHHISGYAGIYMEDGTDEVVSDVMMLVLENTADKDLQLARIRIEYSDFTAEFEVTNIPAGEKVVALEKNRHPKTAAAFRSAEAYNVVFYPEAMSLREDRIQITGTAGSLEVTNISGTDIQGDIYVYYKNSATDLLYGGITYRVRVKGGLAAGETQQVIAGHYTAENSRLLLVEYGD